MEEPPSTSGGIKRSIPKGLQDEMDETAAKLPRVTATPAVLDDTQKRHLVVGICLHSIISPALRKYVVPILTKLHKELIRKYKINTQTYQTHLKKYQPTNTKLNYKAVNHNKAANGKANYDYRIKSVVDLSKLFLLPHMALYTGFDETYDISALLGLIINIHDQFPPAVKSYAEDVREKIRNPWAHCDFTNWDAVKYEDSFQLMETLITDPDLSSIVKDQTLLELGKWKINGPSSLNGTDKNCQLLDVLVKSLKLVAKETDNNSLQIENAQKNCATICSTLTQLKNDMETRFMEINARFLAIEENQHTLKDSQKVEIEFWKEQEVTFVDTPVANVIAAIMESKHNVLIVGEPGIGKSMLMHSVALKVQKNIDYNIIPCFDIQDILQHYKKDNFQMFVLDDICGRFTVSMSDIEHLIKNEDKINIILEKGNTLIAATCRLDIYKDDKFKKSCTIFKSNIFNLSEKYTREDKIKICRSYLSEADIQLLGDQNVFFTPLMCYLYSKNESSNLTEFLQCPFETYKKEWDKLKLFDPCKYCSLFVSVIYNGIIKKSLLYNEENTKIKVDLGNIFEVCGIDRGTPLRTIKSTLDSLTGTYVRKTRNEYKVIHDQMFDFLCCYFGGKNDMVNYILRYADIRVFNQRTQLQSVDEQHSRFTIMISKKHQKKYFERVKREVIDGKLNECFNNTQMKNKVYRTSFLKTLKSIDDDSIIKQIYQRQTLRSNLTKSCGYISIKEREDYVDDDAAASAAVSAAADVDDDDFDEDDNDDYDEDDDDEDDEDDYDDDDNEQYLTKGPIIKSCLRGYYDIFEFFISKSDDIKNQGLLHTLLTAACKGGNEKIVQLLIDKGSEVDQADGLLETHLTNACYEGYEKIVELLIDKECDVNQLNGNGETPLTISCERGHEKIVQLLLDEGSGVNLVDGMEQTPLTAACRGGHEKIVKLLIDKESGVNLVDGIGKTPLTAACSKGHENIVQLLIDEGSGVNLVDGKGQTPLTAACSIGNDEGSDFKLIDDKEQTPLVAACRGGHDKIVQLLLDKGSDITKLMVRGRHL